MSESVEVENDAPLPYLRPTSIFCKNYPQVLRERGDAQEEFAEEAFSRKIKLVQKIVQGICEQDVYCGRFQEREQNNILALFCHALGQNNMTSREMIIS